MAHQSLYRRYRPRTFAEIRGQDHVVRALRNAVAQETEGHAYLFSGPRGTGKTSTARILAKALNCENLTDGQPCAECENCRSIENGTSYDLFELDAASNNGVDAMRDLVGRTAVGSPGRTKVYILDEVHMLSPAASNALLKTLEEPPPHVVFVLATTDPQKVLPTIRSRTQHFEFTLLSAGELTDYVKWIIDDSSLEVDEGAVAHVVRSGRGSARDTLSALDMVVAAGGVGGGSEPVDALLAAVAAADAGSAVNALSEAIGLGREPRVLADSLVVALRDAFLSSVGGDLRHLADDDRAHAAGTATALGTARITRALELLGSALVDMRQATEPRVPLDVALIRICDRDEPTVEALVARIERLEAALSAGGATAAPSAPTPVPDTATAPAPVARGAAGVDGENGDDGAVPDDSEQSAAPNVAAAGAAEARAAIAARRGGQAPPPAPRADAAPESSPPSSAPPAPPPPPAPAPPPPRPAASSAPTAPPAPSAPASRSPEPAPSDPPPPATPAASESSAPPETSPAPTAAAPSTPAPPASPTPPAEPESVGRPVDETPARAAAPRAAGVPGVDQLQEAMTTSVLGQLKGMSKAIFSGGHFVDTDGEHAVFALSNEPTRERAENSRGEVEAALAAHFGAPVPLRLIAESGGRAPSNASGPTTVASPEERTARTSTSTPAPAADDDDETFVDVSDLEDATVDATTGLDKVIEAFPGAKMIEENPQ